MFAFSQGVSINLTRYKMENFSIALGGYIMFDIHEDFQDGTFNSLWISSLKRLE